MSFVKKKIMSSVKNAGKFFLSPDSILVLYQMATVAIESRRAGHTFDGVAT